MKIICENYGEVKKDKYVSRKHGICYICGGKTHIEVWDMEDKKKIKELLQELEEYRDMDLHDPGVIEELKGIAEELTGAGRPTTLGDIIEMLQREEDWDEQED